jgi:hypothetical protein
VSQRQHGGSGGPVGGAAETGCPSYRNPDLRRGIAGAGRALVLARDGSDCKIQRPTDVGRRFPFKNAFAYGLFIPEALQPALFLLLAR